jgi:hypothetical protein
MRRYIINILMNTHSLPSNMMIMIVIVIPVILNIIIIVKLIITTIKTLVTEHYIFFENVFGSTAA